LSICRAHLLEVLYEFLPLIKASISTLATLCRFFCVLTGVRHVVVVDELGSTIYSIPAYEESISVLLARRLHHHHLFLIAILVDQMLLRTVFHTTRPFVLLLGLVVHVYHHFLRGNNCILIVCSGHLVVHLLLTDLLRAFLTGCAHVVCLVLSHLNHPVDTVVIKCV
jgi:hypothetical protein